MNRLQYLLNKLAEEASEISQIALKTSQFGLEETYIDKTNKERCHMEINDLLGVIAALNNEFNFDFQPDNSQVLAKVGKLNKYYEFSKQCGMIHE